MFSATFRYALIGLLELSEADRFLQASVIAEKFRLSPHYLSVVLRECRKLGFLDSQKGNKGGYRLACAADQVNLLQLYLALAGSSVPSDLSPSDLLSEADHWLQSVGERWSAELATTTLADLQKSRL